MTMSVDRGDESKPVDARPGRSRAIQAGMNAVIAVAACGGFALWQWRVLDDAADPTRAQARAVPDGTGGAVSTDEDAARTVAIQEMLALSDGESAVVVPRLIDRLGTEDPEIQTTAALVLGSIGSRALQAGAGGAEISAAIAALVEMINDERREVQLVAASALASIACHLSPARAGDARAMVAGLSPALKQADANVREMILRAIALAASSALDGPPLALITALDDESLNSRATAVAAIGSFGGGLDPWIVRLLRGLADSHPPARDAYEDVLGRIVDRTAVMGLSPSYSTASLPGLLAALENRDCLVRWYAVRLLIVLGPDAHGVLSWLHEFKTHPHAKIKMESMSALSRLRITR